jgi:hypothetical protein
VITKQKHVRAATDASNGVAIAYCDDADDVVTGRSCFTQNRILRAVGATGPGGFAQAVSTDGKSAWTRTTAISPTPGTPSVSATVVLAVPEETSEPQRPSGKSLRSRAATTCHRTPGWRSARAIRATIVAQEQRSVATAAFVALQGLVAAFSSPAS